MSSALHIVGLKYAAYHEAGHFVAAVRHGLVPDAISFRIDRSRIAREAPGAVEFWEGSSTINDLPPADALTVLYAGPYAQARYMRRRIVRGHWDEIDFIARTLISQMQDYARSGAIDTHEFVFDGAQLAELLALMAPTRREAA